MGVKYNTDYCGSCDSHGSREHYVHLDGSNNYTYEPMDNTDRDTCAECGRMITNKDSIEYKLKKLKLWFWL